MPLEDGAPDAEPPEEPLPHPADRLAVFVLTLVNAFKKKNEPFRLIFLKGNHVLLLEFGHPSPGEDRGRQRRDVVGVVDLPE